MSAKFIIGIDLGGTNLKIALLAKNLRIISKNVLNTRDFSGKKLVSVIVFAIEELIKSRGLKKEEILGVGIGVPGPTDHQKGIVHFLPNIPGWREVRLKNILEQRLKIKVQVDNDAKVMSLAEYNCGNARKYQNVLCVTLGTGVGGGIILGSRLYRGKDNAAGEIGHLPINDAGPRCNCGGVACLESYVGNRRIQERAIKSFKRNITLEELSLLASRGNRKALKIWQETASHLGVALSGMVTVLNLDAIVIGGGVAAAGDILFDKVKETIQKRAMSVQARRVKILKAKLGNNAGIVGAAILVKDEAGKN